MVIKTLTVTPTTAKLKVQNVEFSYESVSVLQDVSLELAPAEIMGVIGPNGAGKSTLLRCMDKILMPQKGSILLDRQSIKKMGRMEMARKMGYVPQRASQIFPAKVFDVVLMGRRPHLSWRSSEEDMDIVLEVLQLLQIEDLAMRDINGLSGGQQQNVFFAKALAQEPDVLLLDEPTSNLDIRHQLEVMEIVKSVVKEKGISSVISIHDLNLAARYADKVVMMHEGKIFAVGTPAEVLTAEKIKHVYGVEVLVFNKANVPCIVPIAPLNKEEETDRKEEQLTREALS